MEKNYGAKHAQAWAWQGWMIPRVKGLGNPGMGNFLG